MSVPSCVQNEKPELKSENFLAKHLLASLDFSFIASFFGKQRLHNILHGYNTRSRVRTHQAYVICLCCLAVEFLFQGCPDKVGF